MGSVAARERERERCRVELVRGWHVGWTCEGVGKLLLCRPWSTPQTPPLTPPLAAALRTSLFEFPLVLPSRHAFIATFQLVFTFCRRRNPTRFTSSARPSSAFGGGRDEEPPSKVDEEPAAPDSFTALIRAASVTSNRLLASCALTLSLSHFNQCSMNNDEPWVALAFFAAGASSGASNGLA